MPSQANFVRAWFEHHPNKDIHHDESKKAIEEAWLKLTGKRLEDVDRAIRRLGQEGILIKVAKGVQA